MLPSSPLFLPPFLSSMFGKQQLLFLHLFLSMFVKQLLLFLPNLPSPLLSSPLFCRWWNCLSPYIIWNMSWWSRTYEELGIISSRPYITFSSLLCYDTLMLQVHDQMMIDMFLRPLLLLLVFLIYCCFIRLLWFINIFNFLYLLAYLKHTFLHLRLLFSMSCQCWCCFVDPQAIAQTNFNYPKRWTLDAKELVAAKTLREKERIRTAKLRE